MLLIQLSQKGQDLTAHTYVIITFTMLYLY